MSTALAEVTGVFTASVLNAKANLLPEFSVELGGKAERGFVSGDILNEVGIVERLCRKCGSLELAGEMPVVVELGRLSKLSWALIEEDEEEEPWVGKGIIYP
jgi:hypothetical protein